MWHICKFCTSEKYSRSSWTPEGIAGRPNAGRRSLSKSLTFDILSWFQNSGNLPLPYIFHFSQILLFLASNVTFLANHSFFLNIQMLKMFPGLIFQIQTMNLVLLSLPSYRELARNVEIGCQSKFLESRCGRCASSIGDFGHRVGWIQLLTIDWQALIWRLSRLSSEPLRLHSPLGKHLCGHAWVSVCLSAINYACQH